jgi:hypothetical protein
MSIYGLTYEDYRRISESFPNVRQTAPAKLMRKESRLQGKRSMELRVVGATPHGSIWCRGISSPAGSCSAVRPGPAGPVAVLTEFGARKLLATETRSARPCASGAMSSR